MNDKVHDFWPMAPKERARWIEGKDPHPWQRRLRYGLRDAIGPDDAAFFAVRSRANTVNNWGARQRK